MGAPGPVDDVVVIAEDGPQGRFVVAVPQLDLGQRPPDRARDHAAHHDVARYVQPDQQVRSVSENVSHHVILPLGHPPTCRGPGKHVVDKLITRDPANFVIQRIDLEIRDAEGLPIRRASVVLPALEVPATRTRDGRADNSSCAVSHATNGRIRYAAPQLLEACFHQAIGCSAEECGAARGQGHGDDQG